MAGEGSRVRVTNDYSSKGFSLMNKLRKTILILLIVSASAALLPISASADGTMAYGAATVAGPALNLRTGPGTTYDILTQLNEGDIVVILERTNSDWYHINYHGVVGYVNAQYLRDVLVAENFNAQGKITGDAVNLRSKPTTSSDLLGTYLEGTVMTVIGINSGWYKVKHDGKTGYIRSDYMDIISGYSSSAASGSSASSSDRSYASPAPDANVELGQQIVNYALGFLGSRYVYGGSSPSGFDCSGFVSYVYKNFGYTITRGATGQYRNDGVSISKSDLSVGDLVFFSSNGGSSITHVGLYIGDNEFIHASTPSSGVIISRLDSTYYLNVWYGAKRIITA